MSTNTDLLRPFGHVEDNPILLEKNVTRASLRGHERAAIEFSGNVFTVSKASFCS